MFPWVYEFHWSVFHISFLMIFFSVFTTIVATTILAILRSGKDVKLNRIEKILWHTDFEELSPASKICRHELNGDVQHRICDNEFDCRRCTTHPNLLAARRANTSAMMQFESFGFFMPPYRLYHRGHAWVQKDADGTYKVGLDDFGDRLIGNPNNIELPPIGTEIHVNGTGWRMNKRKAQIRILSPLDGIVIEHGDREKGWLLRVKADDDPIATNHLLKGTEIKPWLMREMERLQMSITTNGVGVTLADGGELVSDFPQYYLNADWDDVLGQMFLQA